MTIELTEEQRQALASRQNGLVEFIDPAPQRRVVLPSAQEYENLRAASDAAPGGPSDTDKFDDGIPPGIRRSQEAFWRDLPELLKTKPWWTRKRDWVAYHGDERVGFPRPPRLCLQQLRQVA